MGQPKDPRPKKDFNLKAVINDVSTLDELLVFQTDESPYLGFTSRATAYVPKVTENVEDKSLLEAAPSSIVKRDVLKRETDEYMYAPGMGMVCTSRSLFSIRRKQIMAFSRLIFIFATGAGTRDAPRPTAPAGHSG